MKRTAIKLVFYALVIGLVAMPLSGCFGVNSAPVADFSYAPLSPAAGDTVVFTDESADDSAIVSWTWNFGDGATSAMPDPTHAFQSAGNYTVSLTVTDDESASDTHIVTITVKQAAEITKDEALRILVSEIIRPAFSYQGISAYMLSQPLQDGDVITSESGADYDIDANTWFIFIDDQPTAFFAHDARYVFMDARTGDYDIVDESWPPVINNKSMWAPADLGRGHLISLYSVLDSAMPVTPSSSTAPRGDYGDAPDGQTAYYGVTGAFPTLYNTTNSSYFGGKGGHTLNIGEETLGLDVSAEIDATDPSDPDGVPNLVDADSDERIFVIIEEKKAKLAFTVTVAATAPDVTRYANALIDFDQSGKWSDGSYGTEWPVVNQVVNVAPGTSETVITPWFPWGDGNLLPSPVWMRLALTRAKVDSAQFDDAGGWDGSGQYEYGEIEDYFVFLTDKPTQPEFVRWPPAPGKPPAGDGDPPPDGGAEPPGPTKGPCGYDINYYVITISGGDSSKDLSQGTPIVQDSVDRMADVAAEQGYTSVANLAPGNSGNSKTSLENIGKAFDNLADAVKCGDYVLIYICGHGRETGGIALKGTNGRTNEIMEPTDGDGDGNSLADFLKTIPPCPDEDCETPGKCCHVSVIIESCYAGNFNVPGVTGEGRAVVGTSTDTPSWATYGSGGVYTDGFDKDLRDADADQSNPPDGVDPMEAHESAEEKVEEFNDRNGTGQEPWQDNQWCECKCPCKPDIDVDKWVFDWMYERWSDETEVWLDTPVTFRLEIESTGKCKDIVDIEVIDYLPDCLIYAGGAVLHYNGGSYSRPPDLIEEGMSGAQLIWDLDELGPLEPGEGIVIEYEAITWYPGPNVNIVYGSAHCSDDYGVVVYDEDSATVFVSEFILR